MTARQRRWLALMLVLVAVVLSSGWWVSRRQRAGSANTSSGPVAQGGATPRDVHVDDASVASSAVVAPAGTVRDRAVRDALRARIVAEWSAGERVPMAPPPPRVGNDAPVPKHDGTLDRHYIQARIREDFVPMAQACYEEMLSRRPGEEVRVTMQFRIVADPRYGGIVDEAHAVDPTDGGARLDAELARCMSESMMAMAFRPPEGEGGIVSVHYPFVMSPGAE